jgi:hypothetical protein
MKFHIEVAGFEKLIQKLKKHPLKKDIISDIDALQTNPFTGKYLKKHNKYELKYPNLRIYYIVCEGFVVICDEEFDGQIIIETFGNKNQQKRYLK